MKILKDISELVDKGVISQETGDRIREYYDKNNNSRANSSRLFVIFGILGAILVGLGIILIIAHNWDELSRKTKTLFAFLPLLVGQILCGFALTKKKLSVAWRESTSAFLFFAVGASISLISQIYNIPGNLSSFLLSWMLLCLPLIYLMKSSVTSLLYLIGITYYAGEVGYWGRPTSESYVYWLFLLSALPHYYLLYKEKPQSNFMIFHNWFVPLSVVITLGTLAADTGELMFIAYMSLFGLFYLIGNLKFFKRQKTRNNAYLIFGTLGTIALLLSLSFNWFWKDLREEVFQFSKVIVSPEFISSIILSLLAGGLLYVRQKNKPLKEANPMAFVFILFIAIFLFGISFSSAAVLINLLVFAIGLLTIRIGVRQDHLGILNYGLLVIAALATCRFFDENISFVSRGVLFLSVGVGFFATNYWMLKKRKANE